MRKKPFWLMLGLAAGFLSVLSLCRGRLLERAGAAVCETVCDLAKCTRFSCCK